MYIINIPNFIILIWIGIWRMNFKDVNQFSENLADSICNSLNLLI
jgi:hypothetical protein